MVGYTAGMVAAIRQRVVVKKGGVVEVRSDELKPGDSAEVIVLVEAEDDPAPTRETDQVKAFEALQRSMGLKPDAAAAWAAEARRERKAASSRRERRP